MAPKGMYRLFLAVLVRNRVRGFCTPVSNWAYLILVAILLISISAREIDLPQVDLINFRVEYVRPRSGRASDEVARGRLVSLEGFSFAFRAKNEEWRDLQLVSQIAFGTP